VLCTRIRPGKDQPELDAPIPPSDSERAWTQRVVSKLLTETRERAQVYLLSDLDGDVVEDLGLGHVSAPEEVTRLSRRFSSCILLGTAQHAQIETDDE
jgi:peroxiredoxin